MKNKILLLILLIIGFFSFLKEPISDTFDTIAGATNQTYNVQIDGIAGASEEDEEDEEEHEDYEEDEE